MGIAGLILGILGIIFSFIPGINWLGIILAIVGLILSIVGLVTSKRNGQSNGPAVAGIVLCSISIVLSIIVTVACVACVAALPAALPGAGSSFRIPGLS